MELSLYRNSHDTNGYYSSLGLSPSATQDQIRKAYRRMIKTLHPDRGGDPDEFRRISQIYAVLTDPIEKVKYDSLKDDEYYLGPYELDLILGELPKDVLDQAIRKGDETTAWYTYYAMQEDHRLAHLWYEKLVPAMRAMGLSGPARLGITASTQPFIAMISSTLEIIMIPKHLKPNYFLAMHILHDSGYGQH